MRTEDLIAGLAADAATPPARLSVAFWTGLGVAIVSAGAVFWMLLGPRDDFDAAMNTMRFPFKFVVTALFGATAAALAMRLSQPGARVGATRWLVFAAPLLLALGVVAELFSEPQAAWMPRMIGTHALICLTFVPILSALPLAALLVALRRGAPASPSGAGAVAGLVAGAVGATFYAAQCTDDSPLFVAVWYPLAIAIVTAVGAIAGSRLLRW